VEKEIVPASPIRRTEIPRTPEVWEVESRAASRFRIRTVGWLGPLIFVALSLTLISMKLYAPDKENRRNFVYMQIGISVLLVGFSVKMFLGYFQAGQFRRMKLRDILAILGHDRGLITTGEHQGPTLVEFVPSSEGITFFLDGTESRLMR
jgi:hypothetical protein